MLVELNDRTEPLARLAAILAVAYQRLLEERSQGIDPLAMEPRSERPCTPPKRGEGLCPNSTSKPKSHGWRRRA